MLLEVHQVTKKTHGLGPVSLAVPAGRKLGIAGASGSGKSTLLRLMAGLLQPDGGSILFNSERLEGPEERLMPGHPRIAYLPQDYGLHNHYRMEELLDMSCRVEAGAAEKIIAICGISGVLKKRTGTLSGGEQQRVALARQLLRGPELLLLDEPFSNLDAANRAGIKALLQSVQEATGVTVVLVSHDAADLLSWADDLLILQEGRMVQQAPPGILYYHPVSAYVSGLMGQYNKVAPPAAAQLARAWGLEAGTGYLHFRPHSLELCRPGTGVRAAVISTAFSGAHYDCRLQWEDTELIFHAAVPLEVGASVYLRSREGSWMPEDIN